MSGTGAEAGLTRYFLLFDLTTALFAIWAVLKLAGVEGEMVSRDEFAQLCWRKTTAATFVALLIVPVPWAFPWGMADGFAGRESGTADLALGQLWAALLAIFFATFQWARFRDARA